MALDGYRVVECGPRGRMAAAMIGTHLQGLGASVTTLIRDSDEYDPWPEATRALNTGKATECLKDRSRMASLIENSDVIIIGYGATMAKSLGIDYDTCHAANPQAIHLILPPFAEENSDADGIEACEAEILAASGVFRDMGLNRQLKGCLASYSPLPLASAYASVVGALAVVTALYARLTNVQSAIGAQIEVPLASALLEMLIRKSIKVLPPRVPLALPVCAPIFSFLMQFPRSLVTVSLAPRLMPQTILSSLGSHKCISRGVSVYLPSVLEPSSESLCRACPCTAFTRRIGRLCR